MEINEILGFIAGVIMILSMIPYMRGILAGRVHPHLFSWLVWTILTAIGVTAQLTEGAGPGAWTTGVNCILCLGVAVLSLRYGEKNITRSDWIAFISALSAIPLWMATKDPFWAVLLVTLIDGVAFIPTWRKSWLKPGEEHMAPYICSSIAFSISLVAMHQINFVTSFYPAVLVLLNAGFVAMVFIRKKRLSVA